MRRSEGKDSERWGRAGGCGVWNRKRSQNTKEAKTSRRIRVKKIYMRYLRKVRINTIDEENKKRRDGGKKRVKRGRG